MVVNPEDKGVNAEFGEGEAGDEGLALAAPEAP